MAADNAPITFEQALMLTGLGVEPQFVRFTHVTMDSDKFICVRQTSPQNSIVIIDVTMSMQPWRRRIYAESAVMNPNGRILALKGKVNWMHTIWYEVCVKKGCVIVCKAL